MKNISLLALIGTPLLVLGETSITSISIESKTIFTKVDTEITVNVEWNETTIFADGDVLVWKVFDEDDTSLYTNSLQLKVDEELPTSLSGTVNIKRGGRVKLKASLSLSDIDVTNAEEQFQAYSPGASLVPLVIIIVLSATTGIVELSLLGGIFIGACMVSGSFTGGFKSTLDTYLIGSAADEGHAFVVLFCFFLAGLVALMEKSGGFRGFANALSQVAKTSRSGQAAAFIGGFIIFFDDYANCLVNGGTMTPILDAMGVSREKLAFIIDATAAPIASFIPLSSWIGYEIGLIETEIQKIIEIEGTDELFISKSGFTVFVKSIKYRYYSIYMIMFIPVLIYLKRAFGPMLVAERKVFAYARTDGGDGAFKGMQGLLKANAPSDDTPALLMNFLFPLFFLIFFIFYELVKSGDDGTGTQSLYAKIESSDSYVALLYGTMATSLLSMLFYMIQFKKNGQLTAPTPKSFTKMCGLTPEEQTEESVPVSLMTVKEGVDSFIFGQAKIFPAIIILILAWAVGAIMTDVGTDRLFKMWILESGMHKGSLPTLSFLISMLIALATGTSWGTMAIMFPLITAPTYVAADGDARLFYATISSILAGAIAGDHMSPISDTTILSSLASECDLLAHIKTQFPYALNVALWSVLFGTLPIGMAPKYPNWIAIVLGLIAMVLTVVFLGVPIASKSGDFDIVTELYMKFRKLPDLEKLKIDTINKVAEEESESEKKPVDIEIGA